MNRSLEGETTLQRKRRGSIGNKILCTKNGIKELKMTNSITRIIQGECGINWTLKMKKILYVVEDKETAQFRYRVSNVIEALKGNSKLSARWVLTAKVSEKDLVGVDLVVILRQSAKNRKVLDFIKLAHEKGIKVLFDLDDLIFDYRDLPILMKSTNSKNVFYWAGYVWGIRRIAKKVDGFITTNEFLGNLLKRSFDRPYAVIPNSLNGVQVEKAKECLKKKTHDGFVVGYFSGSPTHVKDLELIEPQIIKFLDTYDDASFLIVGYMELSSKMQQMAERGKVKVKKLVDYLDLMALESRVDVNIAPLLVNDFTNCKSELKFFEAAVVETTTIASPTYAFKKAISDGENGFLVNTNGWYNKLEYLYLHPEINQKIAREAREYALKNYYGKVFLEEAEKAYEFFG